MPKTVNKPFPLDFYLCNECYLAHNCFTSYDPSAEETVLKNAINVSQDNKGYHYQFILLMFIVFSLILMPYFYSCLKWWKNLLLFNKDDGDRHHSLISKAKHRLSGKGNKATKKVWPDTQAQPDRPALRLPKTSNFWEFDEAQSSLKETKVFSSQYEFSPMETVLDLKAQEDDRDSPSPV